MPIECVGTKSCVVSLTVSCPCFPHSVTMPSEVPSSSVHSWFTAVGFSPSSAPFILAEQQPSTLQLIYFSANVSFSSLPVFLPTIISEMGFASIRAQGLSAPPYLLSFFILICCSFASDRMGQRGYFIIALSSIGGAGYLILALAKSIAARYTAVFLAAAGIFPTIAVQICTVTNSL
jgi:hypothetical protein